MTVRNFAALAALSLAPVCLAAAPPMAMPAAPTIDGIQCQTMEGAVFHIHQHISIFDRGVEMAIPGDLGQPQGQCLYWIHTHTPDGLIHIESPIYRAFTLGNFFDIWHEPLTTTSVASAKFAPGQLRVFVNGARYFGNPRNIELAEHTDITLEAGPPFKAPVLFQDWGGN